jgi:hypothetical protein
MKYFNVEDQRATITISIYTTAAIDSTLIIIIIITFMYGKGGQITERLKKKRP